ncbi:hypothetical protein RB594_002056 [Gaeumannomyces avenae]
MGIWDVFTDIADAVKPWSEVEAEAPAAAEEKPEETTSSKDEPAEKEDEEEEEEEEEEEALDPKERLEKVFHLAHCATQCAAPKLWSVLK